MALWYPPPPPVIGRSARGQPHDPRNGLPPSLLNNPPPPANNPIPNSISDLFGVTLVSWLPPPPPPQRSKPLPPSILNNVITQGGGWNQHDPEFATIVAVWNIPPPPMPMRLPNNPVLLNRVDAPPRYSTQKVQVAANISWQVTWGSPPLKPLVQQRTTPKPPPGRRRKLWHVGPAGIRKEQKDVSEVDRDPPDQ